MGALPRAGASRTGQTEVVGRVEDAGVDCSTIYKELELCSAVESLLGASEVDNAHGGRDERLCVADLTGFLVYDEIGTQHVIESSVNGIRDAIKRAGRNRFETDPLIATILCDFGRVKAD